MNASKDYLEGLCRACDIAADEVKTDAPHYYQEAARIIVERIGQEIHKLTRDISTTVSTSPEAQLLIIADLTLEDKE